VVIISTLILSLDVSFFTHSTSYIIELLKRGYLNDAKFVVVANFIS